MKKKEQHLRRMVALAERRHHLTYLWGCMPEEIRAAFNEVERTRQELARYLDPATISY